MAHLGRPWDLVLPADLVNLGRLAHPWDLANQCRLCHAIRQCRPCRLLVLVGLVG